MSTPSLVLIDKKYFLSCDGEFLISADEVNLTNIILKTEDSELKNLIWEDYEPKRAAEFLEDFKEYFDDYYNAEITCISINDYTYGLSYLAYNKYLLIIQTTDDNGKPEFRQILGESFKLSDPIPYDNETYLNHNNILINSSSTFYFRQPNSTNASTFLTIGDALKKFKEFIDSTDEIKFEDISHIIIPWEKCRRSSYESDIFKSTQYISINSFERNNPYNVGLLSIPLEFKSKTFERIRAEGGFDFSYVDTNNTREVLYSVNVIMNTFKNIICEMAPKCFQQPIFENLSSILIFKDMDDIDLSELSSRYEPILLFRDKDLWYNKMLIDRAMKMIYYLFMKNKVNCKILNKLIRLYYHSNVDNSHIGKIFIYWFVKKVLIPKARKGVDLKAKYNITKQNFSNVAIDIF